MSQWIGNGLQGWAEELLARDFETLLVDEPLEQVLRITLNRPDASNAFNTLCGHELFSISSAGDRSQSFPVRDHHRHRRQGLLRRRRS